MNVSTWEREYFLSKIAQFRARLGCDVPNTISILGPKIVKNNLLSNITSQSISIEEIVAVETHYQKMFNS